MDRIIYDEECLKQEREKNVRAILKHPSTTEDARGTELHYVNAVAQWIKACNDVNVTKTESMLLSYELSEAENSKPLYGIIAHALYQEHNEEKANKQADSIMNGEPLVIIAPKSKRLSNKQNEITDNAEIIETKTTIHSESSLKSNDFQSPNSKNEKREDYLIYILAIIVRVLAITDYFTIYSSNTLTKNILMVVAMLFPMIGDLFSNFFILISPIAILNNQNLGLTQITILIIVFILYIITAALFLYKFFLSEAKRKKAITSILVALLVVYISVVSVIRFNFKTIASNELPSQEGTIHLDTMTSYVSPGENAYISIRALPNTEYSISVEYSSGYSTADGLYTKTSDTNGFVRWNWEVGSRTSSGTYPITITDCNSPFYSETFYFTVD